MSDESAYIFGDPRVNPDKAPPCDDPFQSAEYAAFVESLVPHCRCSRDQPCDGLLAGGLCDGIQDDPIRDDELDREQLDCEIRLFDAP